MSQISTESTQDPGRLAKDDDLENWFRFICLKSDAMKALAPFSSNLR